MRPVGATYRDARQKSIMMQCIRSQRACSVFASLSGAALLLMGGAISNYRTEAQGDAHAFLPPAERDPAPLVRLSFLPPADQPSPLATPQISLRPADARPPAEAPMSPTPPGCADAAPHDGAGCDRTAGIGPPPRPAGSPAPSAASSISEQQAVAARLPPVRPREVRPDGKLDAATPAAVPEPFGPYEPTGFTVGGFLFKPAIELSTGYDSNPARAPGGRGSPFVMVSPELLIRSQFVHHELNAELRGSFVDSVASRSLNQASAEAKLAGRYDVDDNTQVTVQGRFQHDDVVSAGFIKLPSFDVIGGDVGISQMMNRLNLTVKGSVDRTRFDDGVLIGNAVFNTQDRNYTQSGVRARAAFALVPGFTPFVDVSGDRRVHDLTTDFNGFRRDSTGLAARAGIAFALPGTLTGDASIGYVIRRFDDPALEPVGAWTLDATLAWQADAATSVVLVARSAVAETAIPGVSSVVTRDVVVQGTHQFLPWLAGTLRFGYGQDQFAGTTRVNNRYFISASAVYKLTRAVQLNSEVRNERTESNTPNNSFAAIVGLLGLRLQY
jgi:hypothetical protein